VSGTYAAKTTYHDSCSGLRELGIKEQPRKLLAGIEGLKTEEYDGAETCCGFGGIFCIKYSEISDKMATDRIDQLTSTGAEILLGGDLGCLINLAGKLKREGSLIQVRHVAEILAGMTDDPAVGEGKN
jgi:L-lactate dehydrogenase complex protein LldE